MYLCNVIKFIGTSSDCGVFALIVNITLRGVEVDDIKLYITL